MLFLVDFAPLALFLAGYLYRDIFFAIIVLMVTMPVSLYLKYRLTGKFDKMLFWSTVFLFVFGGVSLLLRDPQFLYWKPTALYWALAVAFFASQWIGKKPLVQRFFDQKHELSAQVRAQFRLSVDDVVAHAALFQKQIEQGKTQCGQQKGNGDAAPDRWAGHHGAPSVSNIGSISTAVSSACPSAPLASMTSCRSFSVA